jgi:hypothetical protein
VRCGTQKQGKKTAFTESKGLEGRVISRPSKSIGGKTITDSNYTHILAIVDKSGSMWGVHEQMQSALNEFFKTQAAVEGKCLVDYVQFSAGNPAWGRSLDRRVDINNGYEKVYQDAPVAEATAVIHPGGGTALLDAIGRGTVELGKKLKALPEPHRPGKVLVVVVTDGEENSSFQYTVADIKAMVTKQQDVYEWDYVFLGANIDAVATGGMYGFKADKSMDFNINNNESVMATSAALSSYTTAYRGTAGAAAAFSDDDRKKANK